MVAILHPNSEKHSYRETFLPYNSCLRGLA
jgi:hypothetical protein